MNIIESIEQEEIARLTANKTLPAFAPGDTVVVNVSVVEGTRKRVQAYEGVVIAKRNRGLNSSFIVRKISSGEGIERTFQTYSPLIVSWVHVSQHSRRACRCRFRFVAHRGHWRPERFRASTGSAT